MQDLLHISVLELITRGIPEGFLFVMSIYAYARRRIDIKQYLISVIVVVLFTFLFRFVDVNFGVHIIFNTIVLIFMCVFVCGIELYSVVKGAMITTLIMLTVEAFNLILLQVVLREQFLEIIKNPKMKILAGLPGIILFAVVVINGYYFLAYRKSKNIESIN